MNKLGIPANADNKVVAGENAKAMTEEILKGFVTEVTKKYIDSIVDATWDRFDEYTHIEYDDFGDMWAVTCQFDEGSTERIWEDVEEMCNDEGYDIDLYDWCEENDIDLDDMITDAADEIVEDNDDLQWFRNGWSDYLGVFYKSCFEVTYEKWENEYGNELKALVKDAKSVDELDLDICSRIVDIHYELFDNFNSAGVDMAIEKIVYNEHLNAEKHYEAIYKKAYEEYNN